MKSKTKFISPDELDRWISLANLFVRSLCPYRLALKQFNALSAESRSKIMELFSNYDEIRRKKMNEKASEDEWFDCVMVDAHIIATEYNVDPLTAAMCLQAPCKLSEIIIIRT